MLPKKKKWSIVYCLWFIVFCLWPLITFCKSDNLRIHFIDAGEGDAILIQTPENKTVLIDAGNLISGYKVVDYLKRNNINNLDSLIFTHPHPDHTGGAFFILQMVNVESIYDNGQDLTQVSKTGDLYRWYEELVRKNTNYNVMEAGDELLLDGVVLKVLWPFPPFTSSDFNVNSLVIMLKYKEFRCLLTGDLTIPGEKGLLKRKADLKADILKVGHHGSADASSLKFLKAVSPQISIISVDKDNIRGYPSQEVLKKLKKLGSKIYRTDREGDIIVQIKDEGQLVVTFERARQDIDVQ